ncbi:MAG: hypothetical protein M3389_15490, partial [Actinomycetota bacterium]|nr:hypothetical protein [Actinomycetota bacterium]
SEAARSGAAPSEAAPCGAARSGAAPSGAAPSEPAAVVVADAAAIPSAAAGATRAVVLLTTLADVGGRLADELAPPGWRGEERPAVGDAVLALAEAADTSPVLRARLGLEPLQHRDDWLRLLAAGAFGATSRRVFVFTPPGT